jgi:hypothetical protein
MATETEFHYFMDCLRAHTTGQPLPKRPKRVRLRRKDVRAICRKVEAILERQEQEIQAEVHEAWDELDRPRGLDLD